VQTTREIKKTTRTVREMAEVQRDSYRKVREYETRNMNRETLIEQIDRKIRNNS